MKKILLILFLPYTLFSQNDFENGNSPSVFRFFNDSKINEYNKITYTFEGMDVLNYFGSRFPDENEDGLIDIIMRIHEHLEGEWDLPSTNPRNRVELQILNDFSANLSVKDQLVFDDMNVFYGEYSNVKYFYGSNWGDPTFKNQIGLDDWKTYFEKYNVKEGDDYYFDDYVIEFIPRILSLENGIINDVTSDNLIWSDKLINSNAKYVWDQGLCKGDFDNDGDIDILISGIQTVVNNPSNTNLSNYNRQQFYIFENIGNGKLKADILNFLDFPENQNYDERLSWGLQEGAYSISDNFDSDDNEEALIELGFLLEKFDAGGSQTYQEKKMSKQIGYLDIDIPNKTAKFNLLLDEDEYLYNKHWSIKPRYIKEFDLIDEEKDLYLFFFTSSAGSPVSKMDGTIPFEDEDYMQYFKIYEKQEENDKYKLIDVTENYFNIDESRTLSLDNSGTFNYVDIDNDGDLDIFPQLGYLPNKIGGGVELFISRPNWINDITKIYYFENTGSKLELSPFTSLVDYGFSNFDGDFSIFDDNGFHEETGVLLENFTHLNLYSPNDIDGDGKVEFLTAANPGFLKLYTKSDVPNSIDSIRNIDIVRQEIHAINSSFEPYLYDHDLNGFAFSKDSVVRKFDRNFDRIFIIEDTINNSNDITNKIEKYGRSPLRSEESLYHIDVSSGQIRRELKNSHGFLFTKQIGFTPLGGINFSELSQWSSNKYTFVHYLRNSNDILSRDHSFTLYEKNYPPLPFKVTDYKPINENNNKYVEITFSNSVDINLNSHPYDGSYNVYNIGYLNVETDSLPGVHYGFELYNKEDQSLILSSLSQDYSYNKTLENDVLRSYVTMKIDISSYDINNIYIKIFALDTEDSNIRTYAFSDVDNDGVLDPDDNCILSANADQLDTDGDGIGDVCDTDDDGDGVEDTEDNCPLTSNADQLDTDGDGIGDICDTDDDGDGVLDTEDNCPLTANPDQADWNNNGIGDVCGDPKPLFTERVTFVENIYPNPTDDKLTVIVKPGLEIKDLYFVDFSGKTIKPKSVSRTQNNLDINVSNLNEGIYILEIVSDKEVDKVKVIIER